MYTLQVKGHSDAAHYLSDIPVCENLHGHRWEVEVVVCSEKLNEKGMVVDFRGIKESWKRFDHHCLNDFFEMPTAEKIVEDIHDCLRNIISPATVVEVTVWESPDCGVTYRP